MYGSMFKMRPKSGKAQQLRDYIIGVHRRAPGVVTASVLSDAHGGNVWGFGAFDGWPLRVLAAIGVPFVLAAAWGVFRVPGDGGPPVVIVSGPVRLALECVFFGAAVWLLSAAGQGRLAMIFLIVLVAHYAVGHQRVVDFLTRL